MIIVSWRANRLKSDATITELEAVANFYRRLEDDRRRESEGGGAVTEVCGLQAAVPEMFTGKTKKNRPVSACDDKESGDIGALPSLRLGNGVQR